MNGKTVRRRWGSEGAAGKTLSSSYASAQEAERAFERLLHRRRAGGYELSHRATLLREKMRKAREIRTQLGGDADLASPVPGKPPRMRWSKYWKTIAEYLALDTSMADARGSLQARMASAKWDDIADRMMVAVEDEFDDYSDDDFRLTAFDLDDFRAVVVLPKQVSDALQRMDELDATNGVLILERPVDCGTMFLLMHHPRVQWLRAIRFRHWMKVTPNDLLRANTRGCLSFRKRYRTDIPIEVLELKHYEEAMRGVGPFQPDLIEEFEVLHYGIFGPYLGNSGHHTTPILGEQMHWHRFPTHALNYFALASENAESWGLVFDLQRNGFAPYLFEDDLDSTYFSSLWKVVLQGLSSPAGEALSLGADEASSFKKLDDLLQERYWECTGTWRRFFRLLTVGYLTFHEKPVLSVGLDQYRYFGGSNGLPDGDEAREKGYDQAGLVSWLLEENSCFRHQIVMTLDERFHPLLDKDSLRILVGLCESFGRYDSLEWRKLRSASDREGKRLRTFLQLDRTDLKGKYRRKSGRYAVVSPDRMVCDRVLGAIRTILLHEAKEGRPHAAFLCAVALASAFLPFAMCSSLSSDLLSELPSELCHPFLKTVALELCSSTVPHDTSVR
ncbi:MAG: WGR domain-containing protein [Pseudomonadales bacterium]|nr:WGR domain-containing protein [Pseudomonadales bacterium]